MPSQIAINPIYIVIFVGIFGRKTKTPPPIGSFLRSVQMLATTCRFFELERFLDELETVSGELETFLMS